jgi:hypothetical protein
VLRAGSEELVDPAVGQPGEGARDQQFDLIVEQQFQELDALELEQQLGALALRQVVGVDDLLESELVRRAHGGQERLAVAHDLLLARG